jgi:hypothetical protein
MNRQEQVSQNISGENHHIAGRDINYIPRTEPTESEDHPLITFCPQCKRKEWRLSERCWYCEGNVRQMWDDIEHDQAIKEQAYRRNKAESRGFLSMIIGMATMFASSQWGLPMPFFVIGGVLSLWGAAAIGVFSR